MKFLGFTTKSSHFSPENLKKRNYILSQNCTGDISFLFTVNIFTIATARFYNFAIEIFRQFSIEKKIKHFFHIQKLLKMVLK